MLYASAFLQKPGVPPEWLSITKEDINGFMTTIYGMDVTRGLTLILHTPGGDLNAIETIVAYLWGKFPDNFEVILPTYAMSAGTMLALASDRIVMGRQSQLGPTDPQIGGRSAGAIVTQFERAKQEILGNPRAAHAWAPVLQVVGPSLLQEAQNGLTYAERMVAGWLGQRMLRACGPAAAERAARHFADTATHLSHGRRIDRSEARPQGIVIEDLEDDQVLQDAVLTTYHVATLTFEKGPATKFIASEKQLWVKNLPVPQQVPGTSVRRPTP